MGFHKPLSGGGGYVSKGDRLTSHELCIYYPSGPNTR